ncbi:hypothetical protein [Bacteroides sp. UBA939]|uniref:hypothetical protein n=1 Tax=Bacteroides sp. UBA939 TaxID=1946092 RepID=UPI0025C37E9D|nr:hypothetical protein [Bacteroides sp. UBA939]
MRKVCGLDVHKDSVFVCILSESGDKLQQKFGVLTPDKLTKLDACLQRCNIRISNYVSSTDGKSYKGVVQCLSEGITDPLELIKKIHGRTINRVGREIITASLTGIISSTDMKAHKDKGGLSFLEEI